MLDIGWWELAVIGIVALIVVGPGELPALLRTIGRYVGMAKRQADEFRSQFDEAIRESEFNDLRKELNDIKSGVTSTLDDAQASIAKDQSKDEYDWDKDGPIKPAPEFADDAPTTSFTMADGEVVSKIDSSPEEGPEEGKASVDPPADHVADQNHAREDAGHRAENGTEHAAAATSEDAIDAERKPASPAHDAEAVR